MENNNRQKIDRMMIAKANLDAIPLDSVDDEYIAIQTAISKYIIKHCEHSVISDHIDLDAEKSATIYYCEHCYEFFTEP
jgi:DUF438 domain-containing protein